MDCPYCGRKMEAGELHGIPHDVVYWIPEGTDFNFMILTRKRIEEYGGIVLSERMQPVYNGLIGLVRNKRPKSYYCKVCKAILTKN